MADGDSFIFVLQDLTEQYGGVLDALYAMGVLYGIKNSLEWVIFGLDAARVYFLQPGSVANEDFPNHFGEWAGNVHARRSLEIYTMWSRTVVPFLRDHPKGSLKGSPSKGRSLI